MSAVAPPVRRVQMAAAAALNTQLLLTDQQTQQQFYNLPVANRILNIQNETDPAAGLNYIIQTLRSGRETRRWFTSQLLTTFTGAVRPGFPVDVAPGLIQIGGQQLAGALTAQNYLMTWLLDF